MVSMTQARTITGTAHKPVFITPHYSSTETCLHRYLDSRFIERFNQEVNYPQKPEDYLAWMAEDQMEPDKDVVTLRQPVHRTFYMVSSAIACQQPGKPPLSTDKITSAGFVIRKLNPSGNSGFDIWKMLNGEAMGWSEHLKNTSEPDVYRRLVQKKIISRQNPEPAYNGEEIHPMQVRQVALEDGTRQTIIYGYLPVGGSYTPAIDKDQADNNVSSITDNPLKKLLPWPELLPFISRKKTDVQSSLGSQSSSFQNNKWQAEDGLLIHNGNSTWRFARLLKQAVNVYHIGDTNFTDINQALLNKFSTLFFYQEPDIPASLTLTEYLAEVFNQPESPIHLWLLQLENTVDTEQVTDNTLVGPLPQFNNHAFKLSLRLSETDAQEINYLFDQRLQQQLLKTQLDLPLPKFGQSRNDRYFVQPFIRTMENCREQIHWGKPSETFRVAAPFDPLASRPNMIQLPDIDDVRRGIAKGVSFIAPAKMAKKLQQLNPSAGLTDEIMGKEPNPQLGIGWILSFSLPVITLCAMILLMIVVSVLNFVFYWIPWVITWIPYPKFNNNSSG